MREKQPRYSLDWSSPLTRNPEMRGDIDISLKSYPNEADWSALLKVRRPGLLRSSSYGEKHCANNMKARKLSGSATVVNKQNTTS